MLAVKEPLSSMPGPLSLAKSIERPVPLAGIYAKVRHLTRRVTELEDELHRVRTIAYRADKRGQRAHSTPAEEDPKPSAPEQLPGVDGFGFITDTF